MTNLKITSFGEIVSFHRKKSGLNQLDIANLAGVGKTALFDIEHNKTTVQLDTLLKVLNTLNIKINLSSPLIEAYQKENDFQSSLEENEKS